MNDCGFTKLIFRAVGENRFCWRTFFCGAPRFNNVENVQKFVNYANMSLIDRDLLFSTKRFDENSLALAE